MHTEHVLYTLVDITDTGVNNPRGSTIEFRQSQNLNSLMQVLSMRTQPLHVTVTKFENTPMSEYKNLIIKMNKFLSTNTIITDVGSSKLESSKIIKKFLKNKYIADEGF